MMIFTFILFILCFNYSFCPNIKTTDNLTQIESEIEIYAKSKSENGHDSKNPEIFHDDLVDKQKYQLEKLKYRLVPRPKPHVLESDHIHWIGWNWVADEEAKKNLTLTQKSQDPLRSLWLFTVFILVGSMVKSGYHYSNFFTTAIPESCILILIGLAFGTSVELFSIQHDVPDFTVNLFFYGLLPPIILESAYSLHNRTFFDNIGTILLYAIVGTIMNIILIAVSLFLVELLNIEWLKFPSVPFVEIMIFATAVSAVDPVTILAIFQDLGINKMLYFLVFGESLLNDAVVIVFHKLLTVFTKAEIIFADDVINGFISFLFTSLGGFIIGICFGFLCAFLTRMTVHVRVVEPMIILSTAYLAFLTAQIFDWSGLISLIGCGLIQAEYSFSHISNKSYITVKYCTMTLSAVSDLLIFFFLGKLLISTDPHWNSAFVVSSVVFCVIFRFFSVFILTYISNNYFHRTRIINNEEKFLMAYGGLRGAVAFSVIAIIEEDTGIKNVDLFRSTTLFIILFSVFILGGTTKPLLKVLRIQKETKEDQIFINLNNRVIEQTIAGIEVITGTKSLVIHTFISSQVFSLNL